MARRVHKTQQPQQDDPEPPTLLLSKNRLNSAARKSRNLLKQTVLSPDSLQLQTHRDQLTSYLEREEDMPCSSARRRNIVNGMRMQTEFTQDAQFSSHDDTINNGLTSR